MIRDDQTWLEAKKVAPREVFYKLVAKINHSNTDWAVTKD